MFYFTTPGNGPTHFTRWGKLNQIDIAFLLDHCSGDIILRTLLSYTMLFYSECAVSRELQIFYSVHICTSKLGSQI